jgi:hypothetical protein
VREYTHMPEHTPAPWVLQGFRIYGPLDPRSKHGNGRSLIGGVVDDGIDWRSTQLDVDGRGQFYAESMANARLMVASPVLLQACKLARDHIRSAMGGLDMGSDLDECLSALESAIVDAECAVLTSEDE